VRSSRTIRTVRVSAETSRPESMNLCFLMQGSRCLTLRMSDRYPDVRARPPSARGAKPSEGRVHQAPRPPDTAFAFLMSAGQGLIGDMGRRQTESGRVADRGVTDSRAVSRSSPRPMQPNNSRPQCRLRRRAHAAISIGLAAGGGIAWRSPVADRCWRVSRALLSSARWAAHPGGRNRRESSREIRS